MAGASGLDGASCERPFLLESKLGARLPGEEFSLGIGPREGVRVYSLFMEEPSSPPWELLDRDEAAVSGSAGRPGDGGGTIRMAGEGGGRPDDGVLRVGVGWAEGARLDAPPRT